MVSLNLPGETQRPHNAMTLSHTSATTGLAPVPRVRANLPCATAEPYFKERETSVNAQIVLWGHWAKEAGLTPT